LVREPSFSFSFSFSLLAKKEGWLSDVKETKKEEEASSALNGFAAADFFSFG